MNQFIEEDWEHLIKLESIYVLEHKMQIEEEYYEYEERQNKLPAIITLNTNNDEINRSRIWNRWTNWEKVQKK